MIDVQVTKQPLTSKWREKVTESFARCESYEELDEVHRRLWRHYHKKYDIEHLHPSQWNEWIEVCHAFHRIYRDCWNVLVASRQAHPSMATPTGPPKNPEYIRIRHWAERQGLLLAGEHVNKRIRQLYAEAHQGEEDENKGLAP